MPEVGPPKRNRELAEKALEKKPALGEDIDLSAYSSTAEEHRYQDDPSRLAPQEKDNMLKVGVSLDDRSQRAGTFVQIDRSVVHTSSSQAGGAVMSIPKRLERYAWLQ